MNNNNDSAVGFSWRHTDRTAKSGNWLRDVAIALALAFVAMLLGMVAEACAEQQPGLFASKTPPAGVDSFASAQPSDIPDAPPPKAGETVNAALVGSDPNDDLNRGKIQFRAQNFGLAEKSFRRVVESHPRDAEAWVGLAACYDRLRRFDLADRAYNQAIGIVGPTTEILNNQGYSYMLAATTRAHAKS